MVVPGENKVVVSGENKIKGEKLKHASVSVCPQNFSHRMVWGITIGSTW
jgi:hypothetical protein